MCLTKKKKHYSICYVWLILLVYSVFSYPFYSSQTLLLDVKQTQPFQKLQRFRANNTVPHIHTHTQRKIKRKSKRVPNDLGGRVWSEGGGSERNTSSLTSKLFKFFFFPSFTNTHGFLGSQRKQAWKCEQLRGKSTLFQSAFGDFLRFFRVWMTIF